MQGQEECKQLGVTLSVIKSAKKNDFLLSLMEDNGDPCIQSLQRIQKAAYVDSIDLNQIWRPT